MTAWRTLVLLMMPLQALLMAPAAHADTTDHMQAVYRDWMLPRSIELVAETAHLTHALQDFCDGSGQDAAAAFERAGQAWKDSVVAWEKLSTVSIGVLPRYRMQVEMDFMPTRPRTIVKAIEAAPQGAEAMDHIGAPAKGFPALEWLIWTRRLRPASAECRYAVQVAMQIERDAQFIEKSLREAQASRLDVAESKIALSELLNQWVGGLEHLRWAEMEQPVRKASTAETPGAPEFARSASGVTAASWAAQWATLRNLANSPGPGSLTSILRERGHGNIADALAAALRSADQAMADLDERASPPRVLASARELAALKRVVEDKVAPALEVHIGFSDADGD